MAPALSYNLPDMVFVTGASSGLGTGICKHLLAAGVTTIGVDLGSQPDSDYWCGLHASAG